MKRLSPRKLIVLITIVVSAMPLISLPQVFDGISYIKVFAALICVTPMMPIILKDVFENKTGRLLKILCFAIMLTILLILYLSPTDYRGIFGTPGRHNGLLSLLLYIYFIIFGIYVYTKRAIPIVIKGLLISSVLTCLISFTKLLFPSFGLFPSLNLSSSSFYDNVDNIAPLVSMALTASIILYFKSKNIIYLLVQMPAVCFVIKWQLLQSIVALLASLAVFLLLNKNPKSRILALIPVFTLVAYVSTMKLLPLTPLVNNSSIFERYKIITFSSEIWKEFSLFPIHIDALSDFSSNFSEFIPNQYLDDFHNVYLQMLFSFGLVIGLAISLLFLSPFVLQTWNSGESLEVFPIYSNFVIGLIFGIASGDYMYFGCIFIGYLLGATLSDRQNKPTKFQNSAVLFCLIVLVAIPGLLQVKDFGQRLEVSNQTVSYSPELSDDKYFKSLVDSVFEIGDAEYKFQVARNLYVIGECSFGDLVSKQLYKINSREVRNYQLLRLKESCREV